MKNLECKELNAQELREVEGGVPMAFYMDDATIQANGEAISFVAGVYAGIGSGIIKKFASWLGL